MEVSNFHAPSVKPWLNRPISSYKGTVSYIRDFSTFPFPCINQSWVLHHPSSPRMKQHNLVLVGSFGRENGKWGLPNHRHCSWRTAKYISAELLTLCRCPSNWDILGLKFDPQSNILTSELFRLKGEKKSFSLSVEEDQNVKT